jgi:hypothetical protein
MIHHIQRIKDPCQGTPSLYVTLWKIDKWHQCGIYVPQFHSQWSQYGYAYHLLQIGIFTPKVHIFHSFIHIHLELLLTWALKYWRFCRFLFSTVLELITTVNYVWSHRRNHLILISQINNDHHYDHIYQSYHANYHYAHNFDHRKPPLTNKHTNHHHHHNRLTLRPPPHPHIFDH